MNLFVVALSSILLSVAAQFAFKAGMSSVEIKAALAQPSMFRAAGAVLTHPYVVGGFMMYGVGALLWLGVLTRWEVSKAYPIVGLGFALSVAVGFLLGESVTVPRALGVALICAGVVLVGRS